MNEVNSDSERGRNGNLKKIRVATEEIKTKN